MTSPYSESARDYWAAGWRGIIPLPANAKETPPAGYTGAGGVYPSYADVQAWCDGSEFEVRGQWVAPGNIALRMPPDVIGIDVDTYGGKQGQATLDAAVARWGPLPPTWLSTSRGLSGSGILLFAVPPGLKWPGNIGPDVEIIQARHRYMVVSPSVHPEGRAYAWWQPIGASVDPVPTDQIPRPDGLPPLPETWVGGLTGGALEAEFAKASTSPQAAREWLSEPRAMQSPCRVVFRRLEAVLADLAAGGSRHDTAVRAVMAFAHLRTEGHAGTTLAVGEFRRAWLEAVTGPGPGQRSPGAAEAEWWRLLEGAIGWAVAGGAHAGLTDPCSDPFAGILLPEDNQQQPSQQPGQQPDGQTHDGAVFVPEGHGAIATGGTEREAVAEATATASVPPAWVTQGSQDPLSSGSTGPGSMDEGPEWSRRSAAVALEIERLEIRRDARLHVAHAEHIRTWRQPPGYSLRELLALPDEPLQWRVLDVMPEGSNVLLAAQFKAGKTTLINELTRSVVDGQEFLGRFKVSHSGPVALFNYEVGQAQYARWLRDLGITHVDDVHILNLRGFTMPLGVPMVRDYVVRWLAERGILTWIVDPFARAFSGAGDENSNADVGPFLEILDEIKERSGVSELVMPTHTGRAEFAPGAERARGATRLDDWCDVRWLLASDDEGGRYFRATGRDVDTEETRLEYDPLTRAVTLGQGARPRRAGRGSFGRQAATESLEDVVLEVLGDEPGATLRQLRAEVRNRGVHVRNTGIADATRRLSQQGRIRVKVDPLANGKTITRHWSAGEPDD